MKARQKDPADQWRKLFDEDRGLLKAAVRAFLCPDVPTEQILKSALSAVEGYPFHMQFASVFALRAVVKAAIAFTIEARDSEIRTTPTDVAMFCERDS